MSGRHNTIAEIFNYPCSGKNAKTVCSYDNKSCREQCYKNRHQDIFDETECDCSNNKCANVMGNTASNGGDACKVSVPKFDNMDVINDIYGYKMPTADERLADKQRHSGAKAQKALIGATRTTRAEFNCHFTEELEEASKRNGWWDDFEYEVNEDNYWNNVHTYESDHTY